MTTLAPTLSVRFFPHSNTLVRDLILIMAGSLLVALLAQVSVPLPFTPVPLTGQTLGVLLVGALLGSKRGLAALALYVTEGLAGLPFFVSGGSGWAHLSGPTGGYLLGFVAAAGLVGWLAEHGLERNIRTALLPFVLGSAVIYLCGASWLAIFVGAPQALVLGVTPFIVGDAIKVLLAAAILPWLWRITHPQTD